jgi:hypothetical protein
MDVPPKHAGGELVHSSQSRTPLCTVQPWQLEALVRLGNDCKRSGGPPVTELLEALPQLWAVKEVLGDGDVLLVCVPLQRKRHCLKVEVPLTGLLAPALADECLCIIEPLLSILPLCL